MSVILIEVPNWSKFNPRSDRTNHSWFRLQKDFLTDPAIFALSDAETLLLILIYGECCKAGSGSIKFGIKVAAAIRKTTPANILKQVQAIVASGLIRSHDGNQKTPDGVEKTATDVRTDVTDEQTDRQDSSDSLSAVGAGSLPSPFQNLRVQEILSERGVKVELQSAWRDSYPDLKWIEQEILKAAAWETANPHKKKKQFGKFITNWLSRGWDGSRAKLPSNPVASIGGPVSKIYRADQDPAFSDDQPEADTAKVRAIMDKAFGRKGL